MTKPGLPKGQSSLSPYFLIHDARGFIEFLKNGFGAEEIYTIEQRGVISHSLVKISGSNVMVGTRQQQHLNSTHLYVADVDTTFEVCLSLGAVALSRPTTFEYGDRSAGIKDPYGNIWWLGTHLGQYLADSM